MNSGAYPTPRGIYRVPDWSRGEDRASAICLDVLLAAPVWLEAERENIDAISPLVHADDTINLPFLGCVPLRTWLQVRESVVGTMLEKRQGHGGA